MKLVFRRLRFCHVWAAIALIVAALLFVPERSAEGVEVPSGLAGVGAHVSQSEGDIAVHGPDSVSVLENTAIGDSIATYRVVTATGADVSGEVFTFSLVGDDAYKYTIDSRSGELFTAAWLDFETDVSDTIFVFASSETVEVGLNVTVNVVNVEDSVSTVQVSKANPVPGVYQGNPEHALDESVPSNFVDTEWANWGTILRIVVRSGAPDPDCGTGLDCVRIRLESEEAEAVQELEAIRSGERGILYVAGVMLVAAEGEDEVKVEITGADRNVMDLHLLAVEREDEVEITFGRLRDAIGVENETPEFDDLEFEQDLDFERVDVEFTFDVTDAYSGMPRPEDLSDLDEDQNYMPVTALVHNSQCYSSVESEESLEGVEGVVLEGGLIYCDGVPEIYPIRDDRDFDEIDNGYEVTTSLILGQGMTYFVTFIACDNAGNCTVFDADETSNALLQRIDTLQDEPTDACLFPLAGDGIIEGMWDGTCPSGREPEPYGGSGDRYARFYTFSLGATSEVTITLTSDEDTYLYLLEGAARDGLELFENDDVVPTQDLNSRIEATLEASQYTIEATTYHSQKTGEFTLAVIGIGGVSSDADCSSGVAVTYPESKPGPVSDCEELLAVRDRLAGTAILNWSTDVPMEEWQGITLSNSQGRVVKFSLESYGLSGEIPPELGNIPALDTLSLYDNELVGEIPASLGNLESLEYLDLGSNRLTGEIPAALGNLGNLEALYLSGNDLTGCIPNGLSDINANDFNELGLDFCDDEVVPPPTVDSCAVDMGEFDSRLEVIDNHWDVECKSVNRPDDGAYYARYFTFDLKEEADVSVTIESGHDAYAYLMEGVGERGTVLFEDDDTNGTNPRIRTTLQPGSYTVEATTYEIGVEGEFKVSVDTDALNGRPPVTCLTPIPSNWPSSYFDLNFHMETDCSSVNRPSDSEYNASYFTFEVKFPAVVSVRLDSDEDGYLYLLEGEDVRGRVLFEDDDSVGRNPRIEESLQPGVYTIEATTYAPGITGEFAMEIRVFSKAGEECLHGDALTGLDDVYLFNDCAMLLDAKYVLAAEPVLNWSADVPIKEWEGIGISGNPPRVTEIDLKGRDLKGEVPLALSNLRRLERLVLRGNSLTGEIPSFGNSASLEILDLGANRLNGELDPSLGRLTELERLTLYRNKLSGEIPPELGDLKNLRGLALERNRLSGEIPHTLGGLESMDTMDLSNNRLVGEIPSELAEIPNLYGLFLSGNNLTGCIPVGLRDVHEEDFGDLGLPFCPPPFTEDCLEPLPAVSAITIRDTWGGGCRSGSGDLLARFYTLSLDAPTLVGLGLSTGHGGYLFVREGERRDGRAVEVVSDSRDIVYTVVNLRSGEYTIEVADDPWNENGDFSLMMRIMEEVPSRDEKDISALMALYLSTDGDGWNRSDNWLTDRPPNEWHGVVADTRGRIVDLRLGGNGLKYRLPPELGLLTELRYLHLENNVLVGEIPPKLGKLLNLRELRLSFTNLTGQIPAELSYLTKLEQLHLNDNDLWGEIPAQMGKLTKLRQFLLGNNELSGEIPGELDGLTNVTTFSLTVNNLSGEIPASLGLLANLARMDLSHNGLRGEIPEELSKLSRLEDLLLGGNFLNGSIPNSLGDLRSLRVLDLTNNRLTGEIPPELGKLTNLEILNLGGCNGLTGEIPVEIAGLTNLQELNLYSNSLDGEIPRELANLSQLRDLKLYRNRLTGNIPAELGKLTELEILYLSFNELKGNIPSDLGNLHELRQLDLEENLLTGEIPKSLAELNHLEYSDFRRNELTGCIPFGMRGIIETDPVLPVCAAP